MSERKTTELLPSCEAAYNVTAEVRDMKRSPKDCALCGQTDWLRVLVTGWNKSGYGTVWADSRGMYEVYEGQCVVGVCNRCYHDGCWSDEQIFYTDKKRRLCELGDALEKRMKNGYSSGVWFEP